MTHVTSSHRPFLVALFGLCAAVASCAVDSDFTTDGSHDDVTTLDDDAQALGEAPPPIGGVAASGGGRRTTVAHPSKPVPAFEPASYVFSLDSYQISKTRARHEDTNFVTISVAVNDGQPETKTKSMGDQNDGTYRVNLALDPIHVDSPKTKVTFNYLIVNAGNENPSKVMETIESTSKELAKKGADFAGAEAGAAIGGTFGGPVGSAIGAVAGWLTERGLGFLFANCDGPVASEQVVFTGQDLWRLTQEGKRLERVQPHPGTDSPTGCGSNSKYTTHWSISRTAGPIPRAPTRATFTPPHA